MAERATKPGEPTPGPKDWFGIHAFVKEVGKRKKLLDEASGDTPKKKDAKY